MLIKFCKMQSLGNDFVMIDMRQFSDTEDAFSYISSQKFIQKISDRHFGIGCDLVVLYEVFDNDQDSISVRVRFFNPDGSEAEICGNATRCIGLLFYLRNGAKKCTMLAGEKTFKISLKDSLKKEVSVIWDCGSTVSEFPMQTNFLSKDAFLPLQKVFQVNVGNPHLVLFLENMPSLSVLEKVGSELEKISSSQGTNVGFVSYTNENHLNLLVFERGAGLTLSCGSGAMAAAIAAQKSGMTKSKSISVHQRGGDLQVNLLPDGHCEQIGTADFIFSGDIEIPCDNNKRASIQNCSKDRIISADKCVIYTDGACSGNPGPGGWGILIFTDPGNLSFGTFEFCGGEKNTTNNRMELLAVINALKFVVDSAAIELYTDSQYVKNGITTWIKNWVRNGWLSSDKKPVKNQDLWKLLQQLTQSRKGLIEWKWVRGHNGNTFNERVDQLARNGIPCN